MKKLKMDGFSKTTTLEIGNSYQFSHLINISIWANDPEAYDYVPNVFDIVEVNSLVAF